jgi:threonine dehydrogenase-like Zn-dependent dehydrogenase
MKAITVVPGQKNSISMRDVPEPAMSPEHVLVRTLRVGLCGTDADIYNGDYGEAPAGDTYLILGHENFGVVQEVGKNVKGFAPGDFVVSTVRRPCNVCFNCKQGEQDFCTSGQYTERGIKQRHGYMSQLYSELPQYMNKLGPELEKIGVLLEPMSVVEKAVDQSFLIQRRLAWQPKWAVVFGAGPVGMLAAAILRNRGLQVVVVAREPETDPRVRLASQFGTEYFSVANSTILDLPSRYPHVDLAIEATGSPRVVFDAMQILSPNAVLCLLSVTGGHLDFSEPVSVINQDLVLRNNVVFGSVNANIRHFKLGVQDFGDIERKWPGVLEKLITTRLRWEDYGKWFGQRHSGIKTTLEIGK